MPRHTKLDRAFTDGPFGLPDLPHTIGLKFQAKVEYGYPVSTRPDKRSWKRRRKTRWRPTAAGPTMDASR